MESKKKQYRSRVGIVEALSIQGDSLFAVVRERGAPIVTEAGETKLVDGDLFGNIAKVPEQMLSMAEILIETDYKLSDNGGKMPNLIGQTVFVDLDTNEYPVLVRVSSVATLSGSRALDRRAIYKIRSTTENGDLDNPSVVKAMERFGYASDEIRGVLGEKYIGSGLHGKIGTYGTRSSWNGVEEKDMSGSVDMSKGIDLSLVLNLPSSSLVRKKCSNPTKILSGR
jgi:hypothetical protein